MSSGEEAEEKESVVSACDMKCGYNVFQTAGGCRWENRKCNGGNRVGALPILRSTLSFCFPFSSSQTLCVLITSVAKLSENSFLVFKMFLNYTSNVWIHSWCKGNDTKAYWLPSEKAPISIPLPWGGHSSGFSVWWVSFQCPFYACMCTYTYMRLFCIQGLILCLLFYNFFLHYNISWRYSHQYM